MPTSFSPMVDELIHALRCLPGVGPKSAQRMAFHLLSRARNSGKQLAESLSTALHQVGNCESCRTFSEQKLCRFCSDPRRDPHLLCIIEQPTDLLAIEQTGAYRGYYFVLMGRLSPLDGIGPEQIGLPQLTELIEKRQIQEIILATNPTVEGEATAYYITELVKSFAIKTTRIAHGVPLGLDLECIDTATIARAMKQRSTTEN